jgi:hypothetical protein
MPTFQGPVRKKNAEFNTVPCTSVELNHCQLIILILSFERPKENKNSADRDMPAFFVLMYLFNVSTMYSVTH